MLLSEKTELGSLISPVRNQYKPIYNWHSFKHSYSKELVDNLVGEFKIKKGAWVMDSFCGGGTTLLACKEAGINSSGFDILPFSVFLSNVKTRNYNGQQLKEQREKFKTKTKITIDFPVFKDIPLAKKAFRPKVRAELIRIKETIESITEKKIKDFFNLGFLSILESVSNTSKAGGFLRIENRYVDAKKIESMYFDRIDSMISDVGKFNDSYSHKNISVSAQHGDAREVSSDKKYSAIITSPPYPNRHDYTRIYSLEMLFDFVSTNDELKKIRYETLRSHVEARKKYEATGYEKTVSLKRLITQIENNGTNNPQVIGMLEGYFEDMYLAIKEMGKKLEKKGKIALVVSNVRFAGINVPVDKLLAEAGEQAGLKTKAIWVARYRGNSAQQMKTYKRKPSRESIVIWEK